jgi:hypothetical protein
MCTRGLFIGIVTGGNYNVCNALCSPTLTCHRTITRSLQSFEIYIYFYAPQIRARHVCTMPRHPPGRPPTVHFAALQPLVRG